MKTMKNNLAKLFLAAGFLLISLAGHSQDKNSAREERKQMKQAELEQNFNILDSLLNAKSFVLEADFLQNRYGERVPVNPRLNFIQVDLGNGVLQTGNESRIGYNNLGGVTAEGSVGKWKIYKNSKTRTYTISFNLFTRIGNYDILMKVNSANDASATISGTTSGKLTWHGHLNTVDNSRVFKGMESI